MNMTIVARVFTYKYLQLLFEIVEISLVANS